MIRGLIYDVGMNNGDDTAYYLARGYRVVSVEADPTLIQEAEARFGDAIRDGRLSLVNAAVGPMDGRAEFFICDENRVWNSFDKESILRQGAACRPLEVPIRRFASVLAEFGVPEYLKVDIEGFDRFCIQDLDPADRPRYLTWEIGRLDELFLAQSKGYNAFRCINQVTLSPLVLGAARGSRPGATIRELKTRLKSTLVTFPGVRTGVRAARSMLRGSPPGAAPLRAESPITHRVQWPEGSWEFRFGSSGPIGPDRDGVWKTADEVAYEFLDVWMHAGPAPGKIADWFDIHATTLEADQEPPSIWQPRAL